MKIALIGYGKMGKCIESAALSRGHEIAARIGGKDSKADASSVSAPKVRHLLEHADVCIDFSHPEAVVENTRILAEMGKPIVLGTTGWQSHFEEVEEIVKETAVGLIWAPNFSIGVHLFLQIVSEAAALIDHCSQYDAAGYEIHHSQKIDSPSGTARALAETLLAKIKRKNSVLYDTPHRSLHPQEIHFASVRTGAVTGTHTVLFDSPTDTITLTHQAKNREAFAQGAVEAAEWVLNKKGLFTIHDLIQTFSQRS